MKECVELTNFWDILYIYLFIYIGPTGFASILKLYTGLRFNTFVYMWLFICKIFNDILRTSYFVSLKY